MENAGLDPLHSPHMQLSPSIANHMQPYLCFKVPLLEPFLSEGRWWEGLRQHPTVTLTLSAGSPCQASTPGSLVSALPWMVNLKFAACEASRASCASPGRVQMEPTSLTHAVSLNLSFISILLMWPSSRASHLSEHSKSHLGWLPSRRWIFLDGFPASFLSLFAFKHLGPGSSKQAQFGFPLRMLSFLGPPDVPPAFTVLYPTLLHHSMLPAGADLHIPNS